MCVASKEASTCRSKGPQGEWVIASASLKGKILQMVVVEEVE